ncbi:MAG: DUF4959 domain-containing protein [Bacteroidales bacterium]
MKNIIIMPTVLLASILLFACQDERGNMLVDHDNIAPQPPTDISYMPLYGGARFYYTLPSDEDLLNIEATFTNKEGQAFSSVASYFVDSIDVLGFADTINYDVELYAVDRSGNKSKPVTISVKPKESTINRVIRTLALRPAFGSFFVEWENELEQNINVYVDFSFTKNGEKKQITRIFSSNMKNDRRFINDLDSVAENNTYDIQVYISDSYGNESNVLNMGAITLLDDSEIDKSDWVLPMTNDSIGGVPQAFGDHMEGRLSKVVDGIVDEGQNLNFMHTGNNGRTGIKEDGNMPWNIIIDLGDYYELSRILTHQRHYSDENCGDICPGKYYDPSNVGYYEMYIFDEDIQQWELVSEHKIPEPTNLNEIEIAKKGRRGDMTYMLPDNPQFTKPTRWFRYKAIAAFGNNYTSNSALYLSEISLYGRKANK